MYDRIYGIYDLKSCSIVGPLVPLPSDGAAARMFSDVVHSSGSAVFAHPLDYVLLRFGELVELEDGSLTLAAVARPADEPVLTGLAVVEADRRVANSDQLPLVV